MGNILSAGISSQSSQSSPYYTEIKNNQSDNLSKNLSISTYSLNLLSNSNNTKTKTSIDFVDDDNSFYGMYAGKNKKISEDVCESFTLKTKSYSMHVQLVLDGHGDYGEFIASTCKTFLTSQIINYVNESEKTQQTLSVSKFESFLKTLIDTKSNEMIKDLLMMSTSTSTSTSTSDQRDNYYDCEGIMRNSKTNEPLYGGTTCTICVIITHSDMRRQIINVNVGDSPTMIIFGSNNANGNTTQEEPYFLTTMHSASNPAEQFRIRQSDLKKPFKIVYGSGEDTQNQQLCSTPDIDNINDAFPSEYSLPNITAWYQRHPCVQPANVRMEPSIYAIYPYHSNGMDDNTTNNDIFGIAMTRSIGDFNGVFHGLIHKPDSQIIDFPATDTRQFIICTFSDGIGDLIFYDKFAKEVLTHVNTIGIYNTGLFFMEKYKKMGHQTFGDSYDDACICIYNSRINNKQ